MNARVALVGKILAYSLFWGWNVLFFLVLWMGFGPVILMELFVAVGVGLVPWSFAAYALLLLALPAVGMAVGARWLMRDPGRLLSLFYGVQLPLMVLCLVRLFAVQQLTLSTGLALAVFLVGALGLTRTLIVGFEERTAVLQGIRLGVQSAYLVAGSWVASLAGIYAVALVAWMIYGTFATLWHWATGGLPSAEGLRFMVLATPFMVFWALTMLVFAISPFAALGIAIRAWQVVFRASRRRLGTAGSIGITAAVGVGLLAIFAGTALQPQHRAFATLDAIETDADRRAALKDSAQIRRGLIASVLADERWFDGDPEGDHIGGMYDELLPESAVWIPTGLWTTLMAPFVYHPVHPDRDWRDEQWAESHYGAFFDAPLRRAERDVLVKAARQTWNWQDAEAGLLDIGEERVHLHRQTIDVEPHGDWATVTIHDVYRNHTWDRQEVLAAFSLPESAVLTGLWLGPDDDQDEAFRYVVAPRGAAQEVYKQQVRRRVDPALLEQVGPRQYRLRAFPVEPRTGETSDVFSIRSEGPDLHLWLELTVPRLGNGEDAHWPLPQTAEVRNLFWDRDTERLVDGASVGRVDAWTPNRVAAPDAVRQVHTAVVAGLQVRAEPVGPMTGSAPDRIRVLVDGTRSMGAHAAALTEAITTLQASSSVEIACTREAKVVACPDFDPHTALYWGARPLESQIANWHALGGSADAWVVLTDEGSYELAELDGTSTTRSAQRSRGGRARADQAEPRGVSTAAPPDPNDSAMTMQDWPGSTPLWLLHLGGVLPAATPDPTLDALFRSGGGVATSVAELSARLADPAVVDGYRMTVSPTEAPDTQGPFTSVAARRAIAALDADAAPGSLDHLDHMHQIAVAQSVVTPFSSMIVLVNDDQRQALANAEKKENRFDREVETGAPSPGPMVSAVPEPSTWLLLAAGCGLVGWGRRRGSAAEASA